MSRHLQAIDREVDCYGGCEAFETPAEGSEAEKAFILRYPEVADGTAMTCRLTCGTDTGSVEISASVTEADTIPNDSDMVVVDTGGCGDGITIDTTAMRAAQLVVAVNCEDGCSQASMTCQEDCGTNAASQFMYNLYSNFVRGFGFRNRRLSKYVRGAN